MVLSLRVFFFFLLFVSGCQFLPRTGRIVNAQTVSESFRLQVLMDPQKNQEGPAFHLVSPLHFIPCSYKTGLWLKSDN
ncbi:MAG: hypothetical protein EA362_00775 [Saprospirales bacterium]|nr:MAG: hypothetical protein EA362_00775 [Saprospirales bacterium]